MDFRYVIFHKVLLKLALKLLLYQFFRVKLFNSQTISTGTSTPSNQATNQVKKPRIDVMLIPAPSFLKVVTEQDRQTMDLLESYI